MRQTRRPLSRQGTGRSSVSPPRIRVHTCSLGPPSPTPPDALDPGPVFPQSTGLPRVRARGDKDKIHAIPEHCLRTEGSTTSGSPDARAFLASAAMFSAVTLSVPESIRASSRWRRVCDCPSGSILSGSALVTWTSSLHRVCIICTYTTIISPPPFCPFLDCLVFAELCKGDAGPFTKGLRI